MAANDGEHPVREIFPGIGAGFSNAPGSAGDRRIDESVPVPSGSSGVPNVGTEVPLSEQVGPGEGTSTAQPGQNYGFQSGDPGYTQTGAGHGSGEHYPRRPGQQEAQ